MRSGPSSCSVDLQLAEKDPGGLTGALGSVGDFAQWRHTQFNVVQSCTWRQVENIPPTVAFRFFPAAGQGFPRAVDTQVQCLKQVYPRAHALPARTGFFQATSSVGLSFHQASHSLPPCLCAGGATPLVSVINPMPSYAGCGGVPLTSALDSGPVSKRRLFTGPKRPSSKSSAQCTCPRPRKRAGP